MEEAWLELPSLGVGRRRHSEAANTRTLLRHTSTRLTRRRWAVTDIRVFSEQYFETVVASHFHC